MLKLLTKFKTQSLNEVKPYETNGSFVAFCGETRREIQDVESPALTWPHDSSCGLYAGDVVVGHQRTSLTASAFLISRPQNGDLMKTVHLSGEITSSRAMHFKYDNKENGEFSEIACRRQTSVSSAAEKRKWSEMKRQRRLSKQVGSGADSSSSDEEVKELFTKQQKSDEFNSRNSGKVRPCDRRRHRVSEDRIYTRPSLDFEKMQQKVVWKKSSSSRPRIVKVRSFSGHLHNLPILQDASVVSFQPIQTIKAFKLTPVEEPRALAY